MPQKTVIYIKNQGKQDYIIFLNVNPAKWPNELPTNCLSVCDHLVGLALDRLGHNIAKYAFVLF